MTKDTSAKHVSVASTKQADLLEESRFTLEEGEGEDITMKGTLGAHTTEVPSKCTESQPTGNKKKCFYH